MPGHKTKLQLRHALLLAFLFLFQCELYVPTSFRHLLEAEARVSSPLADAIVLLLRAYPEDLVALCQSVCREPSRIIKRCAKHFASLIFAVRDESAKTVKIMRLKNLDLYGINAASLL